MPRFHFHVHDGICLPDRTGTDLPDLDTAKTWAVQRAGQILSDDPALFWNGDEWHMDVTDDHDLMLFRLTFMATLAPSVPSRRG